MDPSFSRGPKNMVRRSDKKVILFTPGFSERGGAESRSRLLAGGLRERGWEVIAITRAGSLARFRSLGDPGLRIIEIPGWGLGWPGGIFYLLCAVPLALVLARRARVLLSVQLFSQTTAAAAVSLLTRRPFLCFGTTSGDLSEVTYAQRSRVRRLRVAILTRASAVIVQTPEAAAQIRGLAPQASIETLTNPVVLQPVRPLNGEQAVLFAGRFSEEKGLPGLLQAWKKVLGAVPNARLVLAGEGGTFRSVEDRVRATVRADAQLADSVELPGWVNEIGPLMDRLDVFVLPSRVEGLSNALLEACARGRVVVASDIAPNRFVLGDDYQLLFPPGDVEAMSRALVTALTDGDIRAEAARTTRERCVPFSLDATMDRLEDLIADAADSSRN
jgi:glycosyltransferase involved in cell wall biosynthesis